MTQTPNDHVHIIAEAGTNHNADANIGKELIDIASRAGADSVKFQIIYPEGLYVSKVEQNGAMIDNEVIAIRRAGMLLDSDYRELCRYARTRPIAMSASVFDQRGIDLLEELDPPYIKIASCDLNNSPLLQRAARQGRKMIVSTGMSTMREVEQAVEDITATGNDNLVLMHCVSVYPCATSNMNLGFLKSLKENFGFPIGLSDHTENSLAAAAAIAIGATWIEKHFTFDRAAKGYDHPYAMEPDGLRHYIADIRSLEEAMHPKKTKVCEKEAFVSQRARRALYAARDIAAGQTITEEDVLIVRPAGPFAPNEIDLIVGAKATEPIGQYQAFARSHFDQLGNDNRRTDAA